MFLFLLSILCVRKRERGEGWKGEEILDLNVNKTRKCGRNHIITLVILGA